MFFSLSYLPRQYTGLHNFAMKQWMPLPTMLFLYRFWLTEIYICHKPCPAKDKMHDLQITLPMTLSFFFTSGTLHTRYIRTIFRVWGRPFCSLLFVSFFRCCYERNSSHTASLSHFISLIHSAHHLFFYPAMDNSHKRRLFHLHIQHTTHCLFEWRTPVSSSEAVVCGFCLSISLHL